MEIDIGDLSLVIAVVGVGVALIGVMIANMFGARVEANSLRAEAKEDRKDLVQVSKNLEIAITAMQNEMKDFHQRLIDIERSRVR